MAALNLFMKQKSSEIRIICLSLPLPVVSLFPGGCPQSMPSALASALT
jgi:hypothetical protein